MTEWRECKLKDVCKYERISINPQKYKILQFVHYSFPAFDNNKTPEIQFGGQIKSSKYIVKKGYILYNKLNVRFKRIWNINFETPENSICSSEFLPILATKCNQDYLYYFLCSDELTDTMANSNTGTSGSHQRIDPNFLMKYDILLPPLPEQKAIAEVLSSLDDKIDLLTRQNTTLEDLGQAFFRKWFVEDADEKLKKYPLSELMVIQNGFAFRSRDYQDAGKYKIVTIKNVQDGFIDTSGTTFLNQLPVGMPDYVLLTIGDVLISLTGNVGRVGIVVEDNLLLNQRVAKISPYNPEYLPFLYFYFRNETTREYLINLAHGTAQANLSPIETLKTEVSFSKTLIKKYSELFMPMYQKIIKNKQQIIVLQKLRDTLLPKLISGEIRLKM